MHRRAVIRAIGGSLGVAFLVAHAQQKRAVPVVGVLTVFGATSLPRLREGLGQLGYVEGKNIVLEQRSARGRPEALPALAKDLVSLKVDVLYATGPPAIRAAKQATSTIPIVALDLESDPIESGFAESLARPGGNVTGLFLDMPDLAGKWLELLREVAPGRNRVGLLWDSTTGSAQLAAARAVALRLKVDLQVLEVRNTDDIEGALRDGVRAGSTALIALSSPNILAGSKQIAEFALRNRLPAISLFQDFPDNGGLISFGPEQQEFYLRAALFVDKILRGAKSADLPIERPTKFVLAVNLRTAKALGLTIPPSILVRADRVIE